jgi:two-component system, cell cycle sensor histidine kinase and response regulator CckA
MQGPTSGDPRWKAVRTDGRPLPGEEHPIVAALRTVQAVADAPIDLVIIDLTIPGGLGGRETVGKLCEMDPCARAIVSSGYSSDPVMANYSDYGFDGAVAKPVDIQELADTVERALKGDE